MNVSFLEIIERPLMAPLGRALTRANVAIPERGQGQRFKVVFWRREV